MGMPTSKKIVLAAVNRDLTARRMKDRARELAMALRDALPTSYEFVVVLKEGDSLAFFSDSDRAGALLALREAIAELEGKAPS